MSLAPDLAPDLPEGLPAALGPGVRIGRIASFIYRARVSLPVVSTLATIAERVCLLLRIEDEDGAWGWGEVYSTLPAYGAEHRALVLHHTLAPLLLGQTVAHPARFWTQASQRMQAMALQTGEPGPLGAVLGALDCALWDLFARKAGLPLCALLGRDPLPVPAYASGLNPADGPEVVARSRAAGFVAFKQKIGFGAEVDLANLARIRAAMKPGEELMVDVNQGWSLPQALAMAPRLAPFELAWVEEPLMADRPAAEWRACAAALASPLAGGENLRGEDFARHQAWLGVLQPDVGKWGGISGGWAVGRAALAAGRRFCPHWLGGGLGLLASAHLLAAVGGDGRLEVDVNENPLRELVAQPFPVLDAQGRLVLSGRPGLGVEPDREALRPWLVAHRDTV